MWVGGGQIWVPPAGCPLSTQWIPLSVHCQGRQGGVWSVDPPVKGDPLHLYNGKARVADIQPGAECRTENVPLKIGPKKCDFGNLWGWVMAKTLKKM